MATKSFTFKNTGDLIFNDVVLPGHSFILNGYSYHFWIRPKTSFWRLGIRLSKTEIVSFYHPEHRYRSAHFQDNYIDIHLSVGDWNNDVWINPGKIELAQYNLLDEKDHILNRTDTYQEKGEVEWRIQFNQETFDLDVSYIAAHNITVPKKVSISNEFKYFKIFGWADSIDFELNCQLEINSLKISNELEHPIKQIKVGKVIFREGDMFDTAALRKTYLLLLPASTDGTASSNILNRASELGVPYPTKSSLGNIVIHKAKHQKGLFAAYAYSVHKNTSDIQTISDIIRFLSSTILNANFILGENNSINVPLLGTGTGNLEPSVVAEIYDDEFNKLAIPFELLVSIPNENTFETITQIFLGRYTEIKHCVVKPKPEEIKILEKELQYEISNSSFKIDKDNSITYLNLNNSKLNANILLLFPALEVLSLNNSTIENIAVLTRLKRLHTLYLSGSNFKDYHHLAKLKKLITLDLSFNELGWIDFLDTLKNLKSLYLKGNTIKDIGPLRFLQKLETLDISENSISEIIFISELKKLINLNISGNQISNIAYLTKIKNIEILDISNNRINNIDLIIEFDKLNYLKADKNPFTETLQLVLAENENHLMSIRNILLRQEEEGKTELILPAKILMLGNHSSGKSSLLGYFHHGHLKSTTESTHIIKIEKFPLSTTEMPKAIFFDFGGQDYYHGIYKAFLSSGSIYLILWNEEFNNNNQRIDRNQTLTQDFSVQYWLSQKNYIETEKFEGKIDPILLIQSYADVNKRKSFYDPFMNHNIENEFYVSLKQTLKQNEKKFKSSLNEQALKYIKASVLELIKQKQIIRIEPLWYVNFLLYILNQSPNESYLSKDVETEVILHYKREGTNNLSLLQEDLDQLHKQGLILYYKNELPDIVWLNPAALAKFVHEKVLNKAIIKKYLGRVPYLEFHCEPDILKLLHLQKVIFHHEFGENGPEYIIPNFLPLTNDESSVFDLFTFGLGNPIFTLKFQNFLPFGLINQIICFFGRQEDKKVFWRDQLLFTLEGKAKVLIQIDFQLLEIRAFASYLKVITRSEEVNIQKYIFYGILGLYWDLDLLDFKPFVAFLNNEIRKEDLTESDPLHNKLLQYENLYQNSFCRPVDMYISLDDKYFISYPELCNENNTVSIISREVDEKRKLTEIFKNIPIYPFQIFTNRKLIKRKKIVISYSKKDLVLIHKFKSYLVPLFDDELIEDPWYCTELIAGTDWNIEIKQKFEEADIIFFMISDNLMSTRYVKENEIKNAIDKYNKDKSIIIIPILLVHYHFARKGTYDLSRFSALPYTLKPVKAFADENMAWYSISESIRIMIEKDIDPGANEGMLTTELKGIFENIIEKKA